MGYQWTRKANFGGTARHLAVGVRLGNYGYIGTGKAAVYSYKDFWAYNPSTNTWTQKADLSGGARYDAVGFSIGSKGYIGTGIGSGTYLHDFWEYNPSTNTWTQKADLSGCARWSAVGFSIGSKGYIGTGRYYDGVFYHILRDFWEYNPSTNTWTQKANFSGGDRHDAVGFSIEDKGYIGTGRDSVGNLYNDFWEYNPSTNTWTQRTNFGGGARWSAVGFSIGSKGYIGTGIGTGSYHDFWAYNPFTNTWTQRTDFSGGARWDAVGFSIGSEGYIGTGWDSGGKLYNDFWEYSFVINPLSVQTLPAYSISTTLAVLKGQITNDGGDSCEIQFRYTDNPELDISEWIQTGWRGSYYTGNTFTSQVTGLTPAKKYYYFAEARNSAGDTRGSGLSFITLPDPPTNFTATPESQSGISLSWTKGTHADKTVIRAKTESYPTSPTDGRLVYLGINNSYLDSGLNAGERWYYTAWSMTTVEGEEVYSTPVYATARTKTIPTIQTSPASAISRNQARLNAHLVDDGEESCQVKFAWGLTEEYTSGVDWFGDYETNDTPYLYISGLNQGTTYHFRAYAKNSIGEVGGLDLTFTTAPSEVPEVQTLDATNITDSSAVLNGIVIDDLGEECSVSFEYGETEEYGNETTWQTGKHTNDTFSAYISSLTSGAIYHFRARGKLSGEEEVGYGVDKKFLTKPVSPSNLVLTQVSLAEVRITWTKGQGADRTLIRRKIGSYPESISDGTLVYFGEGDEYIDDTVVAGNTYYYRAWSEITLEGLQQYSSSCAQGYITVETNRPPVVYTDTAGETYFTTARLRGRIEDTGYPTDLEWWFEWGETEELGNSTPHRSGSGYPERVVEVLTDLELDKTYYFRIVAQNEAGIAYGAIRYFTQTRNIKTYTKDRIDELLNEKITLPPGGIAGQVLKKGDGFEEVEWGEADGGTSTSITGILLPYSLVAGGYAGNIHFQIEADDSPDFASAVSVDSEDSQTDWKIFTGYVWDDFPSVGMLSTFKSACYLGTDLDGKTYYRWRAYYYDEDNGVYVYGDWFPGVGKVAISGRGEASVRIYDCKSALFKSPSANDEFCLELPFDCEITAIKVYCSGGTSVTVKVQNESNEICTDGVTATAGSWGEQSDDLENTTYIKDNTLKVYISAVSGTVSSCSVILDYYRYI